MKTYNEHYEYCKSIYTTNVTPKYRSVYDLRVDSTFLNHIIDARYYQLINSIRDSINKKIDNCNILKSEWPYTGIQDKTHVDCFMDRNGHAIRINNWFDINELEELAKIIMPAIEEQILGCYGKIEFLHPYRNIPLAQNDREKSSWRWHYDDCPNEFLKLFIHLNEVTSESGCLKYYQDSDGTIPTVETYNTVAGIRSTKPPVYESTRIPNDVISNGLASGGRIIDVTGPAGSYAICTPNIYHKASAPKLNTIPRDVLFFFIRPSMKKYDVYLKDTNSYFPERNVKMYNLD